VYTLLECPGLGRDVVAGGGRQHQPLYGVGSLILASIAAKRKPLGAPTLGGIEKAVKPRP
jgi:hypothetical protein